MKLQTQYNKISVVSSIIVLLIAGIGYYFLLHYVLREQLDETLRVEQVEIQDFVRKNNSLPPATTYQDQKIEFEKTARDFPSHFKTLTIYNADEKEKELSRQLVFAVPVNGQYYAASVTKSQEATEEMIGIILLITLGLIVLLGSLLFFANRFFVKRLWQPFRNTLSAIKQFNLEAPSPINTEKTSIHEFNELNESINMMTEKVVKDYISLKHFTDHASHEMQTPLAVIISKLDILIQDPALSEKNLQHLQGIYNAVDKMSKLSQTLLLLTKIENKQFHESQQVDIGVTVRNKLEELDEWIQERHLRVSHEIKGLVVRMNPQLADTLISNLVVNAIKHSGIHDSIVLRGNDKNFSISNTGTVALDERQIFNRFWKSADSEGTGLGLAIVKRICDQYGFLPRYEFRDGNHNFSIDF